VAARLPNIVVFISDDLGRLDTSIHGSKDVRTPTMDWLAAAGMIFDNAYVVSPSCCPDRFSLLTGLMPARHGAHPNHSQVRLEFPTNRGRSIKRVIMHGRSVRNV